MTELPLTSLPQKAPRPANFLRSLALKIYRMTVLVLIICLIRDYYVRTRIQGQFPIELHEVKSILPAADSLRIDHSDRMGLFILNQKKQTIGYAIRTSPISDEIIGYCGPSDTLIVFDQATEKIAGLSIRSSGDTKSHVKDVRENQYYMNLWKLYSWNDLVDVNLTQGDIEGVSGATMTSMGIAHAIVFRVQSSQTKTQNAQLFRFQSNDAALIFFCVVACLITFTRLKRYHWLRNLFKGTALIYLGFLSGDLLAESLFAGWARYAIPWRQFLGLVVLASCAILIPWTTRRNIYCQSICPHGTAQELLGRMIPAKRKWKIRPDIKRALRWIPGLLMGLILIIIFLDLPIDLAELEAFDAYLLTSAGLVSIYIAVTGLLASLFVPQAYCHYGCPTGAFFEFMRSHGRADHFGKADFVAALFLLITILFNQYADLLKQFIFQ